MPLPTKVSTLYLFLGSVQFYSKFMLSLSTLTELLTSLTRKDMPWSWGAEEQAAFQRLKDLLCTNTLLARFNSALQISISCDAYSIGIGVVLFW